MKRSRTLLFLLSLLAFTAILLATVSPGEAICVLRLDDQGRLLPGDSLKSEGLSGESVRRKVTPRERADRPIDVLHYDLGLTVSFESVDISGRVSMDLQLLEPMSELVLDFLNGSAAENAEMNVTGSIFVDGNSRPFTHTLDLITIDLGSTIPIGQTLNVQIDFAGTPPRDFIMGYSLRWFPDSTGSVDLDRPVVATLSEPDAARSWWPCHDHPFDAATVNLSVTGPSLYTLAAPGLLAEDVDLGGGLRRQTWNMTREIPSYLVSIAMAEYATWEETVEVEHLLDPVAGTTETRTMPLQFFVPPADSVAARFTWANTGEMINRFADLFGPYPFADIKYGMSLFVFGGAMEHPTMSSMGHFTVGTSVDPDTGAPGGEWVSAHELMHQWFGDCVRLERWGEIWLNEGFARWGESLWFELKYGPEIGKAWLDDFRRDSYAGTLLDPEQLFGGTVYNKGAWTVHMLRQVMGDVAFFEALENYLTDPDLRFQAVATSDLQFHCEATYGESLDWFFEPWLTRVGRPQLQVQSIQLGDVLRLQVSQPAERIYRLPLPVRLRLSDGSSVDEVAWIGGVASDEAVTVVDLPVSGTVVGVDIDAGSDFLLDIDRTTSVLGQTFGLLDPYPNPFNPEVTIAWFVSADQRVKIEIFDLRGRKVRTLTDGQHDAEFYESIWDGTDDDGATLASGVYTVRMESGLGTMQTRKITLLK